MHRSPVPLVVLFALVVSSAPGVAEAEPLRRVRVLSAVAPALAEQLERDGFDVLEGAITPSSVDLVVSAVEEEALRRRGLAPTLVAVGRPFREIQASGPPSALPTGYLELDEILSAMQAAATARPDICAFVDLTDLYGLPTTVDGNHLHAVKISDNVAVREDEPAFLMVSAHHCRELVTPVIALDAIDRFIAGHGSDADITRLVDEHEIWIAPVWNPDGYLHVTDVDNLWRKNRRVFTGAVGVDLNRNYPTGWSTGCAGSVNPTTNTYKGPAPASEVETQTMIAWSEDQHFAKMIDYHSSGREVLWSYDCPSHPWDAFLEDEATELSEQSSYMGTERPPSADGEHYQWQLAQIAGHAFLTETQTQFQPEYSEAEAEAARVWPGTLWFLDRPIPTWGHVTDACTGEPVIASITFPDETWENDERNQSFAPFGRYHAFPPPGSHRIVFSAPGYVTEERMVDLIADQELVLDIEMTPELLPTAAAGPDGLLTCDDPAITLEGSASGGNGSAGYAYAWEPAEDVSDPTVPRPTTSIAGTYTLTVTDIASGCTSVDTVIVGDTTPPTAEAGPDRRLTCLEAEASLAGEAADGSGDYSYSWEPATDVSDPTAAQPSTSLPGTYTLTVTDLMTGCTHFDTVFVDGDTAVPAVEAGPERRLTCVDAEVSLAGEATDGSGDYSYSWEPATDVSDPAAPQPTTSLPGLYTLTVTDLVNGCTAFDTVVVDESLIAPDVHAGPDRRLACSDTEVTLQGEASGGSGDYAYSWEPAADVSDPTAAQPTTGVPGSYTLVVTDLDNGCTFADQVEVVAVPAPLPREPSDIDGFPASEPLRVRWADATAKTELLVTWEDVGSPTSELHRGTIPTARAIRDLDHESWACELLVPNTAFAPQPGNAYYLAVSANCDGVPSSYGRSSLGGERPDSAAASGTPCP